MTSPTLISDRNEPRYRFDRVQRWLHWILAALARRGAVPDDRLKLRQSIATMASGTPPWSTFAGPTIAIHGLDE
jgi:hypothetical protein